MAEKDELKDIMNQFVGCGLSDEMWYVHKLFQIDSKITRGFAKWFDKNMIYCEDAHSFVHRLWDEIKDCESYRDLQNKSWGILDKMRLQYLYTHYKTDSLKDIFDELKKTHPRPDHKRLSEKAMKLLEKEKK